MQPPPPHHFKGSWKLDPNSPSHPFLELVPDVGHQEDEETEADEKAEDLETPVDDPEAGTSDGNHDHSLLLNH